MPVVFPLSGRAVPRKPLLFWLLRNPLGQPPVAQCRRTGEIQPKLTREGHLAICVCTNKNHFRNWLHHDPLRSVERSPLFPEHSRIRVLRGKGLDTTQFPKQRIKVCTTMISGKAVPRKPLSFSCHAGKLGRQWPAETLGHPPTLHTASGAV